MCAEHFSCSNSLDVTTLIVAGGEGRRLRPLTCFVPKPMIRWNGKHLIDHTLEPASKFSHSLAVSVSSRVSEPIFGYLSSYWPGVIRLEEPKLLKTGGVIKYHMDTISNTGSKNLLLLMSDHVRKADLGEAVRFHVSCDNDVTVLVSEPSIRHNQVVVDSGTVVDYLSAGEIPRFTSFSSSGEFVFNWEVLSEFLKCKDQNVFDIGWGVFHKMVLANRYKIKVYNIGNWEDLGTWQSFTSRKNRRSFG